MENKKDRLSVNMEYSEEQTIPLALHEMHMARADRRLWRLLGGLRYHHCRRVCLAVVPV